MKVYVASSWRNAYQPSVVHTLEQEGFEVYDFRNPGPTEKGFAWSSIDPAWLGWTTEQYFEALKHPLAGHGFKLDKQALDSSDACVLVLPSGRSAHLEAGYMVGRGKPTVVYIPERVEPDLMNLLADAICDNLAEVVEELRAALVGKDGPKERSLVPPDPLWVVVPNTRPGHPLHPQYSVDSTELCCDPDDGMGPMPYVLLTEGVTKDEADRICAEFNKRGVDPRALVDPKNLVPEQPR